MYKNSSIAINQFQFLIIKCSIIDTQTVRSTTLIYPCPLWSCNNVNASKFLILTTCLIEFFLVFLLNCCCPIVSNPPSLSFFFCIFNTDWTFKKKERAVHRLTNRPTLRAQICAAGRPHPTPPRPPPHPHTQPPGSSWRLFFSQLLQYGP